MIINFRRLNQASTQYRIVFYFLFNSGCVIEEIVINYVSDFKQQSSVVMSDPKHR